MLPVFNRRGSMPSIVDDFFGKDMLSNFFDDYQTGICVPAVNIIEGKDDFRIEVAAPGLDKNDFKIDVKNNVLFISSEKRQEDEQKDEKIMRREFSYSSFSRSFSLPNTVDADKITANHKDGVLNITIPKREEAKEKPPRQIRIS
ncbi:MAG: Hsp20/alpha crystallin family protein [Marinilabiliales bacterium]|nr:MAG: Hsp20/alpha crystallin family protein [Marinilabiliales bacterium]